MSYPKDGEFEIGETHFYPESSAVEELSEAQLVMVGGGFGIVGFD